MNAYNSIQPKAPAREWSRYRFPRDLFRFTALLACLLGLMFAIDFLGIDLARLLPGVCALVMFCIGFAGKLFAEEIEVIDMGPVEAMRSAGANPLQTFCYAVWPQIQTAWTGIAIYTWDVAFRAATVVGFFGAGGMGWYLKRNVQQLETERVAAILLSIVVLVVISELISAWARHRLNRKRDVNRIETEAEAA